MNLKEVPYLLAYKSINFGQILGNISSILLIRGCVFSNVQYTSTYPKSASESSLRLIRGRLINEYSVALFTIRVLALFQSKPGLVCCLTCEDSSDDEKVIKTPPKSFDGYEYNSRVVRNNDATTEIAFLVNGKNVSGKKMNSKLHSFFFCYGLQLYSFATHRNRITVKKYC